MKKILVYQEESVKELNDLFGLFFEDINHAADGGLYGELVQNRSFEFDPIDRKDYHSLTAWEKSDNMEWSVETEKPLNQENIHYLLAKAQPDSYIRNLGYNTGIYVKKGEKYDFSVFAALGEGTESGGESPKSGERETAVGWILRIVVRDDAGTEAARGEITVSGSAWTKYETVLEAGATLTQGRLYIEFPQAGAVRLDMVSLFPQDTFRGRKNGMRKDIAEALCEMKPKFMRFPGGCLTHTGSLDDHARDSMYRWRRTLGALEQRPVWRNNWGYNQTLGIGYYEYFCFCEDIGAKPLPVLPGGFNPHKGESAPLEEIGAWVQEALDLIEFANGGTDTLWGARRADMGHAEPFHLEYIGIGNEEIGDGFFERYPYFHRAIREKYPYIKIVNSAGPFAVGEGYDAGWNSAKKYGSDLIDEHYYSSPEWFLANMHHYDDYDAEGTKVFLGEYASWGNTFYNALVEAAYMTHLEKAPAVALACYAPMLANVDYVNWQPDMLWFDNYRIMKTPNYYVQKLFMEYQGEREVRLELEGLDGIIPLTDREYITGKLAVIGNDTAGRIWDITVTDHKMQEVLRPEDIAIEKNGEVHLLGDIDSAHYALEFKFKRSEGRKGLKIFFGRRDEKNYLVWEFGGWDNWDCNIESVFSGKGSTISHRIFHVDDIEYRLKLEVEGRRIRTYVNGELFNDTVEGMPELEELYVAASVEGEKRTIVKAVNLTGEEKATTVCLKGNPKKKASCYSLKDCSLTAVNTLDEPDKIAPVCEELAVHNNEAEFTVAPHSVNVLVFEA